MESYYGRERFLAGRSAILVLDEWVVKIDLLTNRLTHLTTITYFADTVPLMTVGTPPPPVTGNQTRIKYFVVDSATLQSTDNQLYS